ncbi:MAG TPA: hypothetical protein VHU92_20935 [Streptosporangiaceae bacterium]|jgi:hypothetical protein|nr:hypothetical protein [Streptosporangiaceae bacterium]
MNDHEVLDQVRDSLAGLHMSTPADQIIARARTRRHRQHLTAAAATTATAAVAAGAALGVTLTGTTAPPARPGHQPTELTAFTLHSGPHGTSVLTMRKGDRLNPAALRSALARHGIPAMVTVGKMCGAGGQPAAALNRVIATRRAASGAVQLSINPAAMPAGTRLSIGYFPGGTGFALITDGSRVACTVGRPHGSQPGARVGGAPKAGQPVTRVGGPKAGQPATR